MKAKWTEVVEELIKEAQNIYMECHSCASPDHCTTVLPMTTPINIININSCCSCLLGHILDSIPNIGRMYIKSKASDEYTIIYVLSDAIIEVSEGGALVIPVNKVHEFLEVFREFDNENLPFIVEWLESEGFKI
ncbi:MAG: hypothetical protein N3D82_03970 [Ignisphaera sp.]|nr:hypothetical protein [Ignisphaera sp.]